jgi:hypothetical protein
MKLEINEKVKLSELKNLFSNMFPLLKIEFFRKGHIEGQPSTKAELLPGDLIAGEVGSIKQNSSIDIGKHITVAELERAFHDRYGLNIQVFRKSGDVWLETTITDNMTLEQQNNLAKEKMKPVETVKPGDIDYD